MQPLSSTQVPERHEKSVEEIRLAAGQRGSVLAGAAPPSCRCCSASMPDGVTLATADPLVLPADSPHRLRPSSSRRNRPARHPPDRPSLPGHGRGIHHLRALEELGFGRARHQAGHRYLHCPSARCASANDEAVHEGLGAVIDRLECARHEAGDGPRQQDSSTVARAHCRGRPSGSDRPCPRCWCR